MPSCAPVVVEREASPPDPTGGEPVRGGNDDGGAVKDAPATGSDGDAPGGGSAASGGEDGGEVGAAGAAAATGGSTEGIGWPPGGEDGEGCVPATGGAGGDGADEDGADEVIEDATEVIDAAPVA